MKLKTVLTLLAVCGALSAGAQVPAPSIIIQTQEHLALADALVEAAGVAKTQKAALPQIIQLIMPIVLRGNEDHSDQVRKIVAEEMGEAFRNKLPELLRIARDAYARHLTDQELRDVTAFYSSASGKRLSEVTPIITQESMVSGAAIGRSAGEAAFPKIIERMRKASLKVPTQS